MNSDCLKNNGEMNSIASSVHSNYFFIIIIIIERIFGISEILY